MMIIVIRQEDTEANNPIVTSCIVQTKKWYLRLLCRWEFQVIITFVIRNEQLNAYVFWIM